MITKFVAIAAAIGAIVLTGSEANATGVTYSCAINNAACAAGFLALGNNSSTGSATDSVNWNLFATAQNTTQNNGSIATGSSITTQNNDQVTVYSGNNLGLTTYVEGQGVALVTGSHGHPAAPWDGLFTAGTTVVSTSDGAITLSFGTPLIGLGIDAQILNAGAYTETLTAYSSACTSILTAATSCTTAATGLITSVTQAGISNGAAGTNTSSEGTVPFVGISTNAANNTASLNANGISFVTISASCTGTSCTSGGFAIDTSVLYHYPIVGGGSSGATVPEPGTLGLLGASLAGLGLIRRRRKIA